MSGSCPEGHPSASTDYCDTCGAPMAPAAPSTPESARPVQVSPEAQAPPVEQVQSCPNCATRNVADALFCEACGYDFTTGVMPRPIPLAEGAFLESDVASGPTPRSSGADERPSTVPEAGDPAASPEPTEVADEPETAEPESAEPETDEPKSAAASDPMLGPSPVPRPRPRPPVDGEPELDPGSTRAAEEVSQSSPPATEAGPPIADTSDPDPVVSPALERRGPTESAIEPGVEVSESIGARRPANLPPSRQADGDWVVEVWIDPDWYDVQDSGDARPSPDVPELVPLTSATALVGRPSSSRQVRPDIDCGSDTGVSRRQAQLSSDGRRWWIEDLGSSNGTYVGPAAGPLPVDPIAPGRRVEVDADDRIYVGAWTRLVVRRATEEDAHL